jgi:putative hemolysin
VQVGITLVGVLTGAVGQATLARSLERTLQGVPAVADWAWLLSLILVVAPITYCTLVFGELVPKRLAYGRPEAMAALSAPVMHWLTRIFRPAVTLLSWSTRAVTRLLGRGEAPSRTVTEEDVRGMIGEGVVAGVVEETERDMFERIFRLGDRQVRAVMTPERRVVWLNLDDPLEENLERMRQTPYSRFPVVRGGDHADFLGVVKAKEYFAHRSEDKDAALEDFVRKPVVLPGTARAFRLLELFRRPQTLHFAMVVDARGEVAGIVTLNDVLEAIVGDMPDKEQSQEAQAVRRDDGLLVEDACEVLAIRGAPCGRRRHQTLASLAVEHLDRAPAMGAGFAWSGWHFEIMDMDGRRIDRLLARSLAEEEA